MHILAAMISQNYRCFYTNRLTYAHYTISQESLQTGAGEPSLSVGTVGITGTVVR